jgi:hypothetical protein
MSKKKDDMVLNSDEFPPMVCPLSMVFEPRYCCYEKCMAWNNKQCSLMRFLSFFPFAYIQEKRENEEKEKYIDGKGGANIPYG